MASEADKYEVLERIGALPHPYAGTESAADI